MYDIHLLQALCQSILAKLMGANMRSTSLMTSSAQVLQEEQQPALLTSRSCCAICKTPRPTAPLSLPSTAPGWLPIYFARNTNEKASTRTCSCKRLFMKNSGCEQMSTDTTCSGHLWSLRMCNLSICCHSPAVANISPCAGDTPHVVQAWAFVTSSWFCRRR